MKKFLNDEAGAVTLDWVVLSAGVLILAIGIVTLLQDPLEALVGNIDTKLGEVGTAVDGEVVAD